MNNPWTPERVERLTELWLSGRTRAEVAEDLGPPITESAVKGKVRRLGLQRDGSAAGRREAAGSGPRRGAAAPASRQNGAAPAAEADGRKRGPARAADAPTRRAPTPSAEESPAGEASRQGGGLPAQPFALATGERLPAGGEAATDAVDAHADRLEQRPFRFPGYNECHWPHGEPDNPDFGFCLAPVAPGKSYCDEHAEQAYRKKGS